MANGSPQSQGEVGWLPVCIVPAWLVLVWERKRSTREGTVSGGTGKCACGRRSWGSLFNYVTSKPFALSNVHNVQTFGERQ